MATTAFGFSAQNNMSGGLDTSALVEKEIDTTDANWFDNAFGSGVKSTTLGVGDAVTYSAVESGRIVKLGPQEENSNTVTEGSRFVGIFQGCSYYKPDGTYVQSTSFTVGTPVKANTYPKAIICQDYLATFEAMVVDASGNPASFAQLNLGVLALNAYIGPINTLTGQSTMGLLYAGGNSVQNRISYQFKIIQLADLPGNEWGTAGMILEVAPNSAWYGTNTAIVN